MKRSLLNQFPHLRRLLLFQLKSWSTWPDSGKSRERVPEDFGKSCRLGVLGDENVYQGTPFFVLSDLYFTKISWGIFLLFTFPLLPLSRVHLTVRQLKNFEFKKSFFKTSSYQRDPDTKRSLEDYLERIRRLEGNNSDEFWLKVKVKVKVYFVLLLFCFCNKIQRIIPRLDLG